MRNFNPVKRYGYISQTTPDLNGRGEVEDTRLEAKAKTKDTKKVQGQSQG